MSLLSRPSHEIDPPLRTEVRRAGLSAHAVAAQNAHNGLSDVEIHARIRKAEDRLAEIRRGRFKWLRVQRPTLAIDDELAD